MYTLNKQAIVPHQAQQMFDLVNKIEDYPTFLPWCHGSIIKSRSETEVVASLEIAWKGIHKHFTTCNQLYPYQSINMSLVNGPLRHLEGKWHFVPQGEQACCVTLELEFELTGYLIDKTIQPILQYVANTLVEAFCKQADARYGNIDS